MDLDPLVARRARSLENAPHVAGAFAEDPRLVAGEVDHGRGDAEDLAAVEADGLGADLLGDVRERRAGRGRRGGSRSSPRLAPKRAITSWVGAGSSGTRIPSVPSFPSESHGKRRGRVGDDERVRPREDLREQVGGAAVQLRHRVEDLRPASLATKAIGWSPRPLSRPTWRYASSECGLTQRP